MKIGITIGLNSKNENMWINGIKMNSIFLQNALIQAGHDVILLDCSREVKRNLKDGSLHQDEVQWDVDKFPVFDFQRKNKSCDILILLGIAIGPKQVDEFKASGPNKRVVKYACGNNYVIDMETMIFKKDSNSGPTFNQNIDEVWYVPQQGYHNHHYYAVTHQLPLEKVMPVPFVWDPMFIDSADHVYESTVDEQGNSVKDAAIENVPVYIPGKEIKDKKLCVIEPNLNVVKFSMIPMLIAEDYIHEGGDPFSRLIICSASGLYKNKTWRQFIQKLDVSKNQTPTEGETGPMLMVEHRYPIHYTMSKYADIVISHQWDNPLNYAYLDIMYLQYPLIHNADMIKDAGYYYPDFEIKKGTERLKWVLENHDNNIESYNEKNEKVMTRYTIFNDGLIETYKKLIDNLMAGGNKHLLSLEYNWQTNLYK